MSSRLLNKKFTDAHTHTYTHTYIHTHIHTHIHTDDGSAQKVIALDQSPTTSGTGLKTVG